MYRYSDVQIMYIRNKLAASCYSFTILHCLMQLHFEYATKLIRHNAVCANDVVLKIESDINQD